MSQIITSLNQEPVWKPYSHLSHRFVPPDRIPWLLDPASLTQRLIAACDGAFRVQVMDQRWGRPLPSEQAALGMRRQLYGWIREVRLLCDEQPWVFARTVIPYSTLRGPVRHLRLLGNRPLGAVLFADPSMQRGVLEIAELKPGQALYQQATRGLKNRTRKIWGRRSVFYLSGKPLLVNEIFLPGIKPHPVS